jgi:hypothetical protein
VRFLGKGDKHVSDKKLQRIIRWWKRYQDKKGKKDKKNKQGKWVSILPCTEACKEKLSKAQV